LPKTQRKPRTFVTPSNEIAERLKAGRKGLGLTQAGLAEKAQVGRSALVHYEQGHAVPGAVELVKLARALKLSPNFILSGSDEFFPSRSPEHALVADDVHVLVAKMAVCLAYLGRETCEPVSALLMAMVKQKLSKKDFGQFAKVLTAMHAYVPDLASGAESMVSTIGPKVIERMRR